MILLFLSLVLSLGERLPVLDHSFLDVAPSYLDEGGVGKADVKRHRLEHSSGFLLSAPSELLEPILLQPENLTCANGQLDLPSGRYQIDTAKWNGQTANHLQLNGCKTLTAHGTTLELFAPLVFDSHLEFRGHLSIVAKTGMTCLTVLGSLHVVSGDLSIEGCYMKWSSLEMALEPIRQFLPDEPSDEVNNEVSDDEWEDSSMLEAPNDLHLHEYQTFFAGGAISSFQLTQSSGNLFIRNCGRGNGDYGGAIRVKKSFTQMGGSLVIQNCTTKGNGGAIRAPVFSQLNGSLTIRNCTAYGKRGGAITSQSFTQDGGQMVIQQCHVRHFAGRGGAIESLSFNKKNGNLSVEDCSAWQGGAIFAGSFHQSDGHLSIQGCRAARGGGVSFSVEFHQLGGVISIAGCSTHFKKYGFRPVLSGRFGVESADGGAIGAAGWKVEPNMKQSGGEMVLQNCVAGGQGGAIQTYLFTEQNGMLLIQNCSAKLGGAMKSQSQEYRGGKVVMKHCSARSGGAIRTKTLNFTGGSLHIEGCSTESTGGAIWSQHLFSQSGGFISFRDVSSDIDGGAIFVYGALDQSGGSLNVQNCRAQHNGGAMYVGTTLHQGGDLRVSNCSARSGGAVYLGAPMADRQLWQSENAQASFENCFAEANGGALYLWRVTKISLLGRATFVKCSADGQGGGVYSNAEVPFMASELEFQSCTARSEGAAIYSTNSTNLQKVILTHCESGVSGALTVQSGSSLNISDLMIKDVGGKGQSVSCSHAAIRALKCAGVGDRLCEVHKHDGSGVAQMWCPGATERSDQLGTVACHRCSSGYVRLVDGVNPECQRCPKESLHCSPTKLTMPYGMTVDPKNFSVGMYCPNPVACPGGSLVASQSETSISNEETEHAMCADGYFGDDCSKCAEFHGKADYNPLTCIKCPESSTHDALRSIAFYAAKDSLLFASAAASALSASGTKKQSRIFLNQLMAFATVANIVVTGVSQTKLFADFHGNTRRILISAGLLANAAQTTGDGTASRDCLLRHFGLPETLIYSHMVSTIVPLMLMTLLAVLKGPKLSLVLGTNVFLPGFTAAFGKYLIAFRSKAEDEGGTLQMPFMPSFLPVGRVVIPSIILLCFAVGVLGWLLVIRGAKEEASTLPPHIFYLTGSYKAECQTWEIERLVRKMLLSVFTCAIPVSYSPSLQMEAVSVVLIASLNLQFYYMPYKVNLWNYIEIGLLTTALLLTGLTTTLIANDLHFARSRLLASLLILLVVLLVAVICGTMILLVLWNLYKEWKSKAELRS